MGLIDMRKVAAGVLAVTLIFAIAATATPSIFKKDLGNDNFQSQGLWTKEVKLGNSDDTDSETCDDRYPETGENDCIKAQRSKCKAQQAFSILGILANTASVIVLGIDIGPEILGPVLAGFTSLSYLLIWAISAGNYHGENNVDSDCGIGGSDDDDLSYGASFILFVIAWLGSALATFIAYAGADPDKVRAM